MLDTSVKIRVGLSITSPGPKHPEGRPVDPALPPKECGLSEDYKGLQSCASLSSHL